MHRRNRLSQSILFLALSGVSAASIAASNDSPPTPAVFIKKAAQDGLTEVALGKVALAKSQDPQVRGFAERMVKDHGRANDELASIATSKGIAPPKALDAEHQAMVTRLKNQSGTDFDRAYSEHMQKDHDKAIALFESASNTSDSDIAGFAKKTLPTLEEHKDLAAKLPAGKGMPGGGR